MELIKDLNWRYATKIMNGKIIDEEKINIILEAIRLAPTSIGMQLFKVFVIKNRILIDQIYKNAAERQKMLPGCSHLLIFAANTVVTDQMIDEHINQLEIIRNYTKEHTATYLNAYKSWITQFESPEALSNWTAKQTYIAMAYATIAAASQRIDSTPIEGFDSCSLDSILGLKEQNLTSTLLLPLGYRDGVNDHLSHYPKVRKKESELFERL